MIDPKELRYGNLILDEHGKEHVVSLQTFFAIRDCEVMGMENRFEGIRLTGYLLNKVGFSRKELAEHFSQALRGYEIQIMPSADRWLLLSGRMSFVAFVYERGALDSEYFSPLRMVNSFHKLQNLYFYLTDRDLVIDGIKGQ